MADNPQIPPPILNYSRPGSVAIHPPSIVPAVLLIGVVSLALLPLLLLLFYPVAKQLPIGWQTYVHLWLPDHPDLDLCLYSDGTFGRPTQFDTAWVSVRDSCRWISVDVDVESLNCRMVDDEVAGAPQRFGGQVIADLWKAEGRITTPEQSQDAADAVVAALQAFSRDRLPPNYTMGAPAGVACGSTSGCSPATPAGAQGTADRHGEDHPGDTL